MKIDYFIGNYNTIILQRSLFVKGLRLYNNLPLIVKNIPMNLKKMLRNLYFLIWFNFFFYYKNVLNKILFMFVKLMYM